MEQPFSIEAIIHSKEFTDFYLSAEKFCDYLEKSVNVNRVDFLQAAREKLLKLYSAALKLPSEYFENNFEFDARLQDDDIQNILYLLDERIGSSRYYWLVLDSTTETDSETGCGDLVDDFGDIYKDLKNSITVFNLKQEGCKEHALWQFKFDFDKHWGDHCINALSAIHFILQNE